MPYRNECNFLKTVEDDGNPANGPDLVQPEPESGNVSQTPSSNGHMSQSWSGSGPEQTASLPTRERSSGSSYAPLHGMMPPNISMPTFGSAEMETVSTNELSGTSPEGGQSSRPTPNSSTASDHLAPGTHLTSSGRSSFEASPVIPNLNMSGTSQSEVENSVNAMNAFFSDPSSFSVPSGVSTGLTPQQRYSIPDTPNDFSLGSDWHEISSQPGMTPVAQGVLRTIMGMNTMETMDLAWDSNQ